MARQSGHAAHGVEAVDRHVEQQNVIHLLAKAAEMRREEEIGVNAGDRADHAGAQRPRDAADARQIAAVLNDGVDAAGGLGARDEIACVGERLGHRLFAQHVTAGGKAGANDFVTRRRNDDVEQQIRTARDRSS